MFSSGGGLLLQKVGTDCPGNFSRSLFVNPKVVEPGKRLCFRLWEDCCEPLQGGMDLWQIAFPAIHEQDGCLDFPVVFVPIIEPSLFLMLAQAFMEQTQPLLAFMNAHEKHHQQLHEPGRRFAGATRADTE